MSERKLGNIKWFNDAKGFGFIEREEGEDIFVHFRSIRGEGYRTLKQGASVEFDLSETDKGFQAEDVIELWHLVLTSSSDIWWRNDSGD